MPREIAIALGSVTTYEAWAGYLSALAWPEDRGEGERVARSQVALCAWHLHSRAHEDAEWAWSPQLVKACQSACNLDPGSACNFDPLDWVMARAGLIAAEP